MKKGIHPESYRLVAFKDMSNEHVFITRSCVGTKETIDIDGHTPVFIRPAAKQARAIQVGQVARRMGG